MRANVELGGRWFVILGLWLLVVSGARRGSEGPEGTCEAGAASAV